MDDLLDDAGKVVQDLPFQGCGETLPEGGESLLHGVSHSFTRASIC
jgi:hypothetical protein